jgi:hypothetical protein
MIFDSLSGTSNRGVSPNDERREYKTYVHTIDVLAILQAKAPALLRRSADGR